MVFFTCDACGQSVKKNQVEKHYKQQCRSCSSITCMDCNKVFWGDDYKSHVKCVTEDERYGGKDYAPRPSSQKGTIKQEKWIEHIKCSVRDKRLSPMLSSLIDQLINYNNIPRKQKKFENFARNCLRLKNEAHISQIWQIFSESQANDEEDAKCQGVANNQPSDNEVRNGGENSFKWKKTMKRLLKQQENKTLPIKVLMKLVRHEYQIYSGSELTLSKTDLKGVLMCKAQNSSKFEITDKMVKLVS